MNTHTIALIFVLLIMLAGFLFYGRKATVPEVHVMPDGTMMENSDPNMETNTRTTVTPSTHAMPDGTVMHMMPDGTMMPN